MGETATECADMSGDPLQSSRQERSPRDVSFIIPSYNSSLTILPCIDSIKKSFAGSKDFEIIVADSSDDYTKDLIKENHKDVKVVGLPSPTMPGIARNAGADIACGSTLVFIDADCTVSLDYTERIQQIRTKYDLGYGSILNGTPNSKIGTAEYYLEFNSFLPFGSVRAVDFGASANFFIYKDLFKNLGGFSNSRTAEDVEFALTLRKHDKRRIFFPQLRVVHHNRTDVDKFISNQFLLGKGSGLLRKKYSVRGSFVARHRHLIPLLYLVRLKGVMTHVAMTGDLSEWAAVARVMRELRIGIKSWVRGFKVGVDL